MAKKEFNKKVITIKAVLIILLGVILGISCFFSPQIDKLLNLGDKEVSYVSSEVIAESDMTIHYIDVGQADSTLICLPDDTKVLIDAGLNKSGEVIVEYLQSLNISTIDYFILTHSDADHSGGAVDIFENFEIKNIYRPFQISCRKDSKTGVVSLSQYEKLGYLYESTDEVYKNKLNIVTTATYENFIKAAYNEEYIENGSTKQSNVYVMNDGMKIESEIIGENNYLIEFFAPLIRTGAEDFDYSKSRTYGKATKFYGEDGADAYNNASPVILLEYNNMQFVFTGDAGSEVEEDFLNSLTENERLRFENIEVFQAGHHGSKTSNSQEFLELLTPEYVVFSCGKNNKHGHPDQEVLDAVKSYTHETSDYILRTDEIGNIAFGFDAEGDLAYTSYDAGSGGVVVYWWQIAIGAFIVLSIFIITIKITTNAKATTKRVVRKAKKLFDK